jgi:3'(2'), 5'-bisphosphate nucleotidase
MTRMVSARMPIVTPADHADAALLAEEAGRLLLELRRQPLDPAQLKAQGDRRSHEYLMARLVELHPGDAILSEEGRDDPARLTAERTWIVDPLDGTREFGEVPRTDWAVHVALVVAEQPVAGAVALPAQGRTLSTATPPRLVAPHDGPPRLAVSRTRPPAILGALVGALGATVVQMGSAGAKAMAVVQGEADVYAHSGGQYEWDSAAPVAVALAAGLHCSRLDGTPLRYNQPDSWLPDLLICRPEFADRVVATLRP